LKAGWPTPHAAVRGPFTIWALPIHRADAGSKSIWSRAHKWFNLAALNGSERGQQCRAEIAEDMTAREIAEAQRQARAWLAETTRRAA
jgi:hypothetical protein